MILAAQAEQEHTGMPSPTELRALESKRAHLVRVLEDGASDVEALVDRLRALEAQLRELRARHAALLERQPARQVIQFPSAAFVLVGAFEDIEGTLSADPTSARAAIEARLAPTALTPRKGPKGVHYRLETTLKIEPAALAGGRFVPEVSGNVSCGGLRWEFSSAPKPVILKRIGERRRCRYPGCGHFQHGHGLCDGHRNQLRRGVELSPLQPPRRGAASAR